MLMNYLIFLNDPMIRKFIMACFYFMLCGVTQVQSQTPVYNLKAKNFLKTSANSFTFEIFLQNTSDSVTLQYSGGQYFFDINPEIANSGTLSLQFEGPDTSDLPVNLRPRNPQVSGSQLRLATNTFPGPGNGFMIPLSGNPPVKIAKLKVSTSSLSFSNKPLNFKWRNQTPDPFTKIFAYVSSLNVNITNPSAHTIDSTSLKSIPTYDLSAKNFKRLAPNILEFEINIKHNGTNYMFEYSGGQYFFNFNQEIANGGTLSYNYSADTSALPVYLRPRNPQISGSQLRLATNTFPAAGNGFVIPHDSAGTMIVKMRLATTAASFADVPFCLQWRREIPDPFTKIFAFSGVLGNLNTNISSFANFTIDSTLHETAYNIKVIVQGFYRPAENFLARNEYMSVMLRNFSSPYELVDSSSAIIDSITFTGNYLFNAAPSGNYFIVAKFKNAVETWSRESGEYLSEGSILHFDFTDSINKAYGKNLTLQGDKYCLYSGDVNYDNICDIVDMGIIENDSYFFTSGNVVTDLNADDIVDIADLGMVDNAVYLFVQTVSP